jgi:hypothetical protein
MQFRFFYPIIAVLLLAGSLVQCRKERLNEDSSAQLEFSNDTIFFDTVFSTVGSATQYLRVRNPYNESIRIDEIALESGSASQFRINIDGLDGPMQVAAQHALDFRMALHGRLP